jgi:hypothetical protein
MMKRKHRSYASLERRTSGNGQVEWQAHAGCMSDDLAEPGRDIQVTVLPDSRIWILCGARKPLAVTCDTSTAEGQAALMDLAERLAVTEWEIRYGVRNDRR